MHNKEEKNTIIIRNGYLPKANLGKDSSTDLNKEPKDIREKATVLSNFLAYGYIPSTELVQDILTCDKKALTQYWKSIEPSLKKLTGEDLNISEYILYKNFPKEVLEMSNAMYWLRQFFVYQGLDYKWIRQKEKEKEPVDIEEINPKVLHKAPDNVLEHILMNLKNQKNRWNDNQEFEVKFILSESFKIKSFVKENTFSLENFGFKENGIQFFTILYNEVLNNSRKNNKDSFSTGKLIDKHLEIKDATDVLRFAASISNQDVSLRKNIRFKNFKRAERKALLSKFEHSNNLEADIAQRPELFKKLFSRIHPGDYDYHSVKSAYDKLYNNNLQSFNSQIEEKIQSKDPTVLEQLVQQTGQYIRRFHNLYELFGNKTIEPLKKVSEKANLRQLVDFKKYIKTINNRQILMYPPKGQWSKVKLEINNKMKINEQDKKDIINILDNAIKNKLIATYPSGFSSAEELEKIKLQSNDQKLAEYGRGTVFDIPENINFIRTSSYWNIEHPSFLDNTWNFFNENWEPKGVCCWNEEKFGTKAVFSGDAVNEKEGKAAQLIDIYLDKLEKSGVRYAVWSSLSYSNIPFDDFEEAHMGLQMGTDPEKGKNFDPSRVTYSFPLLENAKSKVIAYIDIKERQLIYTDANLKLNLSSGNSNQSLLSSYMPAYIEYLSAQPSVYDILETHSGDIPALYSDKDVNIQGRAYVFKPENENNNIKNISITEILESETKPVKSKLFKP